jgi:hypothetical protein
MNGTAECDKSHAMEGGERVAMYKPFESISPSVSPDMALFVAEPRGVVVCPTSMM